jgi:predicted N-formylglutamate amidohydrolase
LEAQQAAAERSEADQARFVMAGRAENRHGPYHRRILRSDRAFDPGALPLVTQFARRLAAPSEVTRLLVDLNRSLTNPTVFSEFTATPDESARRTLLDGYYHPCRRRVESLVSDMMARAGGVVYLSVRSLVSVLKGKVRNADVSLLYDPSQEARTPVQYLTIMCKT